ncbi:MAG: hypothetical protein O3A46_07905 [Candidatus Poribacteria bacterium]|nr:hypothetical protein [Candidatus Poribacteria bacterium]
MAFERFGDDTGKGILSYPTVTLTPEGYVSFSMKAVKEFELNRYGYIVLFYDRERKRVGIMPTKNETDDGALQMKVRRTGISVYAAPFLRHYKIFPRESMLFKAEWDDALNMAIIELRFPANVAIGRI